DEFAELANVGSAEIDLAGLELVYGTSTGGTVDRTGPRAPMRVLRPSAPRPPEPAPAGAGRGRRATRSTPTTTRTTGLHRRPRIHRTSRLRRFPRPCHLRRQPARPCPPRRRPRRPLSCPPSR